MTKHLLVAYDGSPSARKALDFGIDLGGELGADLFVLAVIRPPELADDVETEAVIESAKDYFDNQFAQISEQVKAAGVQTRFEVAFGHPAEQIVLLAEKYQIDHIVMGHRGNTPFRRWLLGSVSKQVIDHASCTVTVVR